MRRALLTLPLLLSCAEDPTEYLTPVDFHVEREVAQFEVCVSEGAAYLVEDGSAIWTTQTACLDQTAGVFEDVVLRSGRAYRVRSDVAKDAATFEGFVPVLDQLVTSLTLAGEGSCASMAVHYTCEGQDLVEVFPGPLVAGDRLTLPVLADTVDAALCFDPEGVWALTAAQLSSETCRL